jgi:hypothetical protein
MEVVSPLMQGIALLILFVVSYGEWQRHRKGFLLLFACAAAMKWCMLILGVWINAKLLPSAPLSGFRLLLWQAQVYAGIVPWFLAALGGISAFRVMRAVDMTRVRHDGQG